jgi:tetratricopeptide (TPR) repeat protein
MVVSGPAKLAIARHNAALEALDAGRVDDARRLSAIAAEAATAAFGPESPDLANVLLTCVDAAEFAGDHSAAQALAERAATVASPLAATDDTELMALWVDIEIAHARIFLAQGDFDQAEARLTDALLVASQVLADDDSSVLSIHDMRGVTAKHAGRFDDSAAHYARLRAVLDVEPVADEQGLAVLLHNLGGLAHSRGHVAEGLAHAQRGLKLRIGAVGEHHPDVAGDLNAIGALLQDAGDPQAAEAVYRRALRIFENTLGTDHYEVGMACANLAVTLAAASDPTEARHCYERGLRILQSTLSGTHPDVALVQHNLATLMASLGDLGTADRLLAEAEVAMTASLPPEHPRLLDLHATKAELRRHRSLR